ncbi:MAG: hypothetical protein LQ340_005564 [Diploschistes diacapsis]|nr:MAG: hypothetical protein LQ340_005564 [Diploschistes diacapsis]
MRARHFIFQLFYSTTFTLLLLAEILLLLISPGDLIYQSLELGESWNIIIIAGVYALTLFVALFIIATRLYTARTQLTAIPRSYVPIREGDISRSVRKLITEGLARSAVIAYNAHPREVRQEEVSELEQTHKSNGSKLAPDTMSLTHMRTWLKIEHPGWSSPCSPDMPSLHYELVLLEFPNLIETKAVSLAPPDPLFDPENEITNTINPDTTQSPPPDPLVVSILQRPASMPLREYLSLLSSLHMLPTTPTNLGLPFRFLALYETSRFSQQPLHGPTFRALLADFTTILQSLQPPSPSAIASLAASSSNTSISSARPSHNPTRIGPPSYVRSRASRASPTPSAYQTPFQTPHLMPYPASLSSGHAGDQSSGPSSSSSSYNNYNEDENMRNSDSGNESGSERSAHTAFTRPGRRSRTNTAGTVSRYGGSQGLSASASARAKRRAVEVGGRAEMEMGTGTGPDLGPGARVGAGLGRARTSSSEISVGQGSVVRRSGTVKSAGSGGSRKSGESGESVIRREDRGEEVLDLPVAFLAERGR